MRNHTIIYLQSMGYDITDFIPCEICGKKAVDIHHISSRGMGGSKEKDTIENLMALCRVCHEDYGDIKVFSDMLVRIHDLRRKIRLENL